MPALSSTMTEGKIVSWLKSPGDKVARGEALVVVESGAMSVIKISRHHDDRDILDDCRSFGIYHHECAIMIVSCGACLTFCGLVTVQIRLIWMSSLSVTVSSAPS